MDGDIPQLFHVCCGGGLEAVKQFVAQNRISAADVRNCGVLCMVCATGHLEVAVWLTDQFGLAPADVDSAMTCLRYRPPRHGTMDRPYFRGYG